MGVLVSGTSATVMGGANVSGSPSMFRVSACPIVLRSKDVQAKIRLSCGSSEGYGGEGGIRTPDTRKGMPDFESGAIDRTLPPLRILSRL
jgi:hypothetical protein